MKKPNAHPMSKKPDARFTCQYPVGQTFIKGNFRRRVLKDITLVNRIVILFLKQRFQRPILLFISSASEFLMVADTFIFVRPSL